MGIVNNFLKSFAVMVGMGGGINEAAKAETSPEKPTTTITAKQEDTLKNAFKDSSLEQEIAAALQSLVDKKLPSAEIEKERTETPERKGSLESQVQLFASDLAEAFMRDGKVTESEATKVAEKLGMSGAGPHVLALVREATAKVGRQLQSATEQGKNQQEAGHSLAL